MALPAAGWQLPDWREFRGWMVMIIANDATVKAGGIFPNDSAKKVIRQQNIAIDNRIPTLYLQWIRWRISAAAGRGRMFFRDTERFWLQVFLK